MTGVETCLNCGQPLHSDSNYCGVCGAPRPRRSDPGGFGSEDDPWGDRQIEAESHAQRQLAQDLEQDRLSPMGRRTGAYLINQMLPGIAGLIPFVGIVVWAGLMLYKWRRGQDIGAAMLGLRVVRGNGELAGFYHMWTRNLAAILSIIPLGAGYWTAYFDKDNRTWHDKLLDTYVIRDNEAAALRPGTSSPAAVKWFWGSLLFVAAIVVFLVLALAA